MIIKHSKQWPLLIAGSVASLVIAVSMITFYLRLRAIDPKVTMEFGYGSIPKPPSTRQTIIASTIEGEVAHTAERIGEATALALSACLYVTSEQIKGRAPRGAPDLLAGIAARNLLPPGLSFIKGGGFVSAYSALSIRYRPAPLGIEVISIGHKMEDGSALMVRIPDELSDKGEARLFFADSLSNVRIPAPFAPSAEVIALGWSPEHLRSLK
jgi:hypothetical protein